MEVNISKAMQIVGGILLGVILLSLLSHFFSSIGIWPQTEDDLENAEQLAKFNLEYEVYDKKGMYGVDVISCLNKAQSNNLKYAEGGSFLTGNKYGDDFYVEVYVRLTKKEYLEESLEVYAFNDFGQERQLFNTVQIAGTDQKLGDINFDIPTNAYTTFSEITLLETQSSEIKDPTKLTNTTGVTTKIIQKDNTSGHTHVDFNGTEQSCYYGLRDDNEKGVLASLIELSKKSDNGNLTKTVVNSTGQNLKAWSKVIWKTALYDFKSKRFKCDYLGYSQKTGRVNIICFSEI